MSTHKHIDLLCAAAMAVCLLITVLFMNGCVPGILPRDADEADPQFAREDRLLPDTDSACHITLTGDGADVSGGTASFSGGTLRIAQSGTYVLSGSLTGSIEVDAASDDTLFLVLGGVDVHSRDGAALYVRNAKKTVLVLAQDTENFLSSGENSSDPSVDGTVYSRDDLTLTGSGSLTVSSGCGHGIVCNDDLIVTGGDITVSAPEDAIHAHDSFRLKEASLTLHAGDDAVTVSNDEGSGYIYIASGSVTAEGCYEGLEASTVTVCGGTIDLTPVDDGINAERLIDISGGDIRIINADGRDADGLDSNGDITVSGGRLFISVSQSGGSCAVDYGSEHGGSFRIDGGTVVACGSSAMVEEISQESAQPFIARSLSGDEEAWLRLLGEDGTALLDETIPCAFTHIILSCPALTQGEVCRVSIDGGETEAIADNSSASNGFVGRPGGDMPRGETFPGGDMPQMPDGQPPQPPGGSMPQMPDGASSHVPGGEHAFGGDVREVPDGQTVSTGADAASTGKTFALLGVSALVLAAGIVAALCVRH